MSATSIVSPAIPPAEMMDYQGLYLAARDLAGRREMSELLPAIADQARGLLQASGGAVYLYDAVRLELTAAASAGAPAPPAARVPAGRGLAGTAVQSPDGLYVADYPAWPERAAVFDPPGLAAAAGAPLLAGAELLGALLVYCTGAPEPPLEAQGLPLLALLAEAAALSIRNLRQLEATRRRLSEVEVHSKVAAALRIARTPDEAFPLLLDETLAGLNAEAGSCWLYDAANDELVRAVARGAHGQLPSRIKPYSGVAGRVFKTGQPYAAREFRSDPYAHESVRAQTAEGWGGAAVPRRVSHDVIGVLFIGVSLPRELTLNEVNLLVTIADLAGSALQRTRESEQPQQQRQRLTAQRTIDNAIATSLDLNITLSIILDQVTTRLNVNAACVMLLNQNAQQLEYAAGRGFYTDTVGQLRLRLNDDYMQRAALGRRSFGRADLPPAADPFVRSNLLAAEGFVMHYGAPLIAKGRLRGLLEVFHRSPAEPDGEWFEFLDGLAAQAAIAIENAVLFTDLRRSNNELAQAYDTTLEGWSRALELRDQETEGHTQRVTEATLQLARALDMPEPQLVHVRRGALLHDMGKMGIPDGILLKPGPLTPAEREIMERHPEYAYQMLSPIAYLAPALDIPYAHHEKWDGSGYPRRLAGEAIPLPARMFAVVDVWDALRSKRPYRDAWPEARVRTHLRELAGSHFEPVIVETFLELLA